MSVRDIKEPKKTGKGGKKPPKDSGPKAKPTGDDSPWKVNTEGKRERATRALPHEVRLREFFAGISGVAALAGDGFTGAAIEAKSEELAYGYAKLAQADPRVKRVIAFLMEGSAWAEAAVPTIGLVIVVGWHYGVIPDQVGVPMVVANGLVPISREQEIQMRREAQRFNGQGDGDGTAD